jgi:chromosome segregation ATPase
MADEITVNVEESENSETSAEGEAALVVAETALENAVEAQVTAESAEQVAEDAAETADDTAEELEELEDEVESWQKMMQNQMLKLAQNQETLTVTLQSTLAALANLSQPIQSEDAADPGKTVPEPVADRSAETEPEIGRVANPLSWI